VKLYSLDLSPFAARCRLQIHAKGLDVPLLEPPGGLSSDEYKRTNPTGKVPALELDDGTVIPESLAILEYLEDVHPEPSLRPGDPALRARMRAIEQLVELYIVPHLVALFGQVDPKQRDAELVKEKIAAMAPFYDVLDRMLGETPGPLAVGEELSLADCALFPIFFFATRLHPLLGDESPVARHRHLASWWESVQKHPAVQEVDGELGRALAAAMGGS
jgi:glutathione S-transferase